MQVNWPPATDPGESIPEDFLASAADLAGIVAHFAAPGDSHSSRRDHELAQAALFGLLSNIATGGQPQHTAAVAAQTPAPRAADKATKARAGCGPGGVRHGRSTDRQPRLSCKCGECKWCLSNARWDRIFAEKFDDPTYYGTLKVRHNSSLAGGF